MQTICTLLQAYNHTNTPSLDFTGRMLFLTPNEQCQSIEGIIKGKVFPYSLSSVGPGADPGVQAVSPQVT